MQRTQWTQAQREQALALVAEVGSHETARRLGIPVGTVASWAKRNGVTSPNPELRAGGIRSASLAWEERRLRLKDKLGDAAERFVDLATSDRVLTDVRGRAVVGGANDSKNYMIAASISVDKAQLLAGAATTRTEATQVNRDELLDQARQRADRHLRSA